MKVVSCYDKIEDGMIQTVTLKVEEDGKCLQEATFEIVEDGTVAVFKSNHLYIDDENMIKRCFDEIATTLKKYDITQIGMSFAS
ncbi:MAG: hypothetical protein Q4E73_11995 [Lachnospiraceae bacterium]|nr:hypothetical protein [Lachnospiraceae bacterium]